MGWLYLPKIEPTAGQKGFVCGDVFVPVQDLSFVKKLPPTNGLIFHFTGESSTAETGQEPVSEVGSIQYAQNVDGIPCVGFGSDGGLSFPDLGLPEVFDGTLSAWVYFTSSLNTNYIYVVGWGLTTTSTPVTEKPSSNDFAFMVINSSGKNTVVGKTGCFPDGSSTSVKFDLSMELNTWYHFVMRVSNNTVDYFIDGNLVASKDIEGFASESSPFLINCFNGNKDLHNPCNIAGVRVYNRALSDEEIKTLDDEFTENSVTGLFQKGVCIELNKKASPPTSGLVFHLSGETDSLTAETGQVFTKTGDSVVHTSNDGFPCWYTPSGQWMYSSDEGLPTRSSPWTQTVWVKCETNPIGQTIVLAFGHLGASRGGQALSFVNKTAIRSVGGVGQDFSTDPGVIDPLIWNHVAITYDGSTIAIYVNGEVVKSGSHSKRIRLYGSNGLGIGGCDWETPFQGWIRDARIYNRALSPSEIKSFLGGNKKAFIPLEEVQPEEGAEFEKSSEEMPSDGLILHVPLAQSATEDELGNELSEIGNVAFTTVEGIQCADISDTSAVGGTYIGINAPALSASGAVPVSFSFWVAAYEIPLYKNEFFYYGRRNENDFPDYKSMFVEITKYNRFSTNFGGSSLEAYPGFHHIAYMCTGTKTLFYVDGVLQFSDNIVWDYGGNTPISLSGGYFAGFRMYNRALSESEVRTLSREWKKPVPDAPIGTSGILISSSTSVAGNKFQKNEAMPTDGLVFYSSLGSPSSASTGQTIESSSNVSYVNYQGMPCAKFDNSYLNYNYSDNFPVGKAPSTMSIWMNYSKDQRNWPRIFSYGDNSDNENRVLAFLGDNQRFGSFSNGCNNLLGDSDVPRNKWNFVLVTFDGSTFKLYIDAQLIGSAKYSTINTTLAKINIGSANSGSNPYFGYLSTARIYNRVLDDSEIQTLYTEWQLSEPINKIFIPVMDKIVTEPTMFEKIVAAVNENSGIEYTTTVSEFGEFSDSSKWNGGVLAPNGKIYGIPYNSTTVLEIDPVTQTATTFGSLSGSEKWNGGVLAPNGKIYGIPYNSTTVLEIDPVTQTATTFGSLSGSEKWNGGVLAPNGKIYGIPRKSGTVLEIDPEAQTATTFGNVEISSSGIAYIGGVLAPNGKIYAIPYNAGNILKIDPEARTVSTFGTLSESAKWSGGVLAPNGKIYGIPYGSSTVLEIDPETDSISTFGSLSGSSKWDGGVLASNGKIYGIPRSSSSVLEIDPLTGTVSTFGSISLSGAKWSGGVLAPNGKIYGIPRDSRMILEINPETRTASTFQTLSSSSNKWRGGTLAPNGKIYAIPFNASTILEISFAWSGQPFTAEICTSSYLNKF